MQESSHLVRRAKSGHGPPSALFLFDFFTQHPPFVFVRYISHHYHSPLLCSHQLSLTLATAISALLITYPKRIDTKTVQLLPTYLPRAKKAMQEGNKHCQEHTWSSEPAQKRTSVQQSSMSKSKPVNLLSRLPTELAFVILYQIPYRSLAAMTRVDRYWRTLILQHDNSFWYRLCQKHGYLPSDPVLYSGHASGGHKVLIQLGEALQMRPGLTRALEQSSKKFEARISSSSSPNHDARIDKRINTWCRLFEISTILEAEWKVGKPTIKELRGHQDPVLCVKILPLWDRIVTGDRSGCLKIWCATTGACLRTFRQHRMGVSSLVFQKNILISGSWVCVYLKRFILLTFPDILTLVFASLSSY